MSNITKDLIIFNYLIFQVLSRNLCTCLFRKYCYHWILDAGLGENSRGEFWLATRTIARYPRDVVKTHARNSDVTRDHASASTHWPFMKSRPEARSPSGSVLLGSAGCTRTENAPAGRSVGSLDFIHLPDNRRVPVRRDVPTSECSPSRSRVPCSWRTVTRYCLLAVVARIVASL